MAKVVSSQSPAPAGLGDAKSAGSVPSDRSVETSLVFESETVPLRDSIRVLYETCLIRRRRLQKRTFQRGSSQHGNALRASIVSNCVNEYVPCLPPGDL